MTLKENDYANQNSGKAIADLIDALRDVPVNDEPIDREIDSDGTEIILTNEELAIEKTAERMGKIIEEGLKNGEARG